MQTQTITTKRYGWRRDHLDPRDLPYLMRRTATVMPRQFSLRPQLPACYDQGSLGSCTGNALAGIVAARLIFEQKMKLATANTPAGTPSRLFIYYNERWIEGTVHQDAGAEIRDGIKSLAKQGTCFEDLWPYNVRRFTTSPTTAAFNAALKDVVKEYQSLKPADHEAKKNSVFHQQPVAFGFNVYDSFESDTVAGNGLVPVPKPHAEERLGGHAVAIVGWDDDKIVGPFTYADGSVAGPWRGAWEVRNSWGKQWGDHGHFWMPFEYGEDSTLCSDLWTVLTV